MADRQPGDTARRPSAFDKVAPETSVRVLDEIIKGEVTGGARVVHRDRVTAVLAKGRDRLLVVVDPSGTLHVDRLERSGRVRGRLIAIVATAMAALLAVGMLIWSGTLPL